MRKSDGFTLIELVAILVIIGVLSLTLLSRSANQGMTDVLAGRDQLVAALFFAQQKAMTVSDPVAVIVGGNSIDVRVGGISVQGDSFNYPLLLPAQVSISAATINYLNRLGEVNATSLTLTHADGSNATVTVTGAGYAY